MKNLKLSNQNLGPIFCYDFAQDLVVRVACVPRILTSADCGVLIVRRQFVSSAEKNGTATAPLVIPPLKAE